MIECYDIRTRAMEPVELPVGHAVLLERVDLAVHPFPVTLRTRGARKKS